MRLELESKWTNVIHELLVVDFDPLLALIFFLFFFCVCFILAFVYFPEMYFSLLVFIIESSMKRFSTARRCVF